MAVPVYPWLWLFLTLINLIIHPALAIWPKPQYIDTGSSVVWYSSNVRLQFIDHESRQKSDNVQQPLSYQSDYGNVHYGFSKEEKELTRSAFELMKQDIVEASFIPWKFYPPNTNFEPKSTKIKTKLRCIKIDISSNSITQSNSTEAYRIRASAEGTITITTRSIHGVRHAFTTIAQFFYIHSSGGTYSPFLPLEITDWPRFPHRGLNLDISRGALMPEDVIKTLKNMKWSKFNRLHVHATDSQSWLLEIPALPELARRGAYRSDHIWTVEALQQVQKYGLSLGIEVYLEIDIPGHTASIHHAYPDLITGYKAPLAEYSAFEPPSGQLRLNSSSVHSFLTTLFTDLIPRVAPYSKHFHLGGDEFNTAIYALDPTLNTTNKQILQPLLQSIYNTILPHLTANNLTPIFWQEALLDWNLTLPPQSIIQIWRPDPSPSSSSSIISEILSRGHSILLGSASHWYLDCGSGTFLLPSHTDSSPIPVIKPPYADWCTPLKSWHQIYSYDPFPLHHHNHHQNHDHYSTQDKILGGEIHLWTELTDSVTLDSKLWPRAAAAGEILWLGFQGEKGVNEDVMRRLAGLRERFVARGVGAGVVGMAWCLMNRGGCLV